MGGTGPMKRRVPREGIGEVGRERESRQGRVGWAMGKERGGEEGEGIGRRSLEDGESGGHVMFFA